MPVGKLPEAGLAVRRVPGLTICRLAGLVRSWRRVAGGLGCQAPAATEVRSATLSGPRGPGDLSVVGISRSVAARVGV
jgi:hypothetical protein